MKTLVINAHPDFAGANHASLELTRYAKELVPNPDILELYNTYLPRLDADMLAAWGGANEPKHEMILARQNELLEQFLASDVVLIFSPLHNFGVTSALKDYFDNILIAGKTFKYVSGGSVGLLDNSKKVAYIQASGSKYTREIKYINLDLAPLYVRSVFGIMGITQTDVIRLEGLSMSATDKPAAIARAKDELKQILKGYNVLA